MAVLTIQEHKQLAKKKSSGAITKAAKAEQELEINRKVREQLASVPCALDMHALSFESPSSSLLICPLLSRPQFHEKWCEQAAALRRELCSDEKV